MTATDAQTDKPTAKAATQNANDAGERSDNRLLISPGRFIASLQKLYTSDTGRGRAELAVLRRNTGNTLAQQRGANWFYEYLNRYVTDEEYPYPNDAEKARETYFLVATLYAGDKTAQKEGIKERGNLGQSLCHLRHILFPKNTNASNNKLSEVGGRDTAERRLGALLDAPWDENGGELAFRLRQTIKLLTSQKVSINWPLLLEDLIKWDQPSKLVQKRWARSFYDVRSEYDPDDEDTLGDASASEAVTTD